MNQLLDQDRAELNNEIAGDAMVVIEAEWRILVGSIFAANETLGIEGLEIPPDRGVPRECMLAKTCPSVCLSRRM